MELIRLTARLVLFTSFMGLTATLAGTLLLVEALFRCRIDRAPFARICFNGASRCLGFRMSTQGAGLPRCAGAGAVRAHRSADPA